MNLPLHIPVERMALLARLLCRANVTGLGLRADGRLLVDHSDGSRCEAEVDPTTTVFPALIVLRYRVEGRTESLALPRAAVGKEAHRRLRVWLRCRAAAGISASA